MKNKHAKGPDGQPLIAFNSGRGRGRPKKNSLGSRNHVEPTSSFFFRTIDKVGGPMEPTVGFNEIYTEIFIKKKTKVAEEKDENDSDKEDGDELMAETVKDADEVDGDGEVEKEDKADAEEADEEQKDKELDEAEKKDQPEDVKEETSEKPKDNEQKPSDTDTKGEQNKDKPVEEEGKADAEMAETEKEKQPSLDPLKMDPEEQEQLARQGTLVASLPSASAN